MPEHVEACLSTSTRKLHFAQSHSDESVPQELEAHLSFMGSLTGTLMAALTGALMGSLIGALCLAASQPDRPGHPAWLAASQA